jgi:hypothetical protein
MLPGNCLVGAILLWLWFGGRIVLVRRRHFIVRTPRHGTWHFAVVWDIFPPPLHYILFFGRFEEFNQ